MPVFSLPRELLALTFREVLDDHEHTLMGTALVHIMLVCKLWRAVALAEPHLWAQQPIDVFDALECDSDCFAPVISRSGNLPLTLTFSDDHLNQLDNDSLTEKYDEAYEYIQRKASRVGDLSLSASNDELFRPVLEALLSSRFPLLKSLYIMMPIDDDTELYHKWDVVDCDLFCRSAPMLRDVCTVNVPLPWDSTIVAQLTHVDIVLESGFLGPAPTAEQFLRFLQSNAGHREELHLSGHLLFPDVSVETRDISSIMGQGIQAVKLRRLGSLKLTNFNVNPAFVLSCIQMPPTARIHIKFEFNSEHCDLLSQHDWDYLPYIIPRSRLADLPSYRTICVEGIDPASEASRRHLVLHGYREQRKITARHTDRLDSDLAVTIYCDYETSGSFLRSMFPIMHPSTVECAYFTGHGREGLQELAELLPQLSSLIELKLTDCEIIVVLQKLGENDPDRGRKPSLESEGDNREAPHNFSIVCPHLEVLTLNFTDSTMARSKTSIPDLATLSSTAKTCLENRKRVGAPLKRVVMELGKYLRVRPKRTSYMKSLERDIRHLVDEITLVDGNENSDSDSTDNSDSSDDSGSESNGDSDSSDD